MITGKTRYKLKICFVHFFLLITGFTAIACPVCEKQQPAITQGLTHGTGPQSNWDWLIIALIFAIAVLTLVFSVKYLIRPGEGSPDHIKQSVLNY